MEDLNFQDLLDYLKMENCYILWYGFSITDEYLDEKGLKKNIISFNKRYSIEIGSNLLILKGLRNYWSVFKGCYKVVSKELIGETQATCKIQKVNCDIDKFIDRLILRNTVNKSNFYGPNPKNFVIDSVRGIERNRNVKYFESYDKVDLTFNELKEVVDNEYDDYRNPLSKVKGIYMIIDCRNGRKYIGSASGSEGIWGRWKEYANTLDGGNDRFKKLKDKHGEKYFKNFKYIILEILSPNISTMEIIEKENFYKDRFLTRRLGYNLN